MKIILSPVKGWWKKRLSQKSLVDEKRSGRPSFSEKSSKKWLFPNLFTKGGGAPEN
jgi:hypothetical protein